MTTTLWLLGVEVLPNLHLATHHHEHSHAPDGSIIQLGRGEGREHERDHTHDHEHARGHDHDHDHDHPGDDDLAALGVAYEHVEVDDELWRDHGLEKVVAPVAPVAPEHAHAATNDATHRHLAHRGELAIDDAPPLGHAALGIAHRDLALHEPPPPLLAPVAAPHVSTWTYSAPNERLTSAQRARPTARGPPVA